MNDLWENVWELINESYGRIAELLRSTFPDLRWSSGHSDNESFPFRAYASYSKADSVDVVASVDFRRSSENEMSYSADIGLDDGQILADGPAGTIGVASGLAAARPEVDAVTAEIVAFFVAGHDVISAALAG